MAKRFTDTEIWEQDWYIDLPNKYKLLWNYIKDKCDNVGIWRPNKSILQKIVGEPINFEEFLSFVNLEKERLRVLPSGRWWIKDFFIFQYGNRFSPESNVHKGALKALVQNGIHIAEIFPDGIGNLKDIDFQQLKTIAYSKDINTLSVAYGSPINRTKDKDKEQDKEKDNKERGYGGKPSKGEKAVSFSEDGEYAIFACGYKQKLGELQKQEIQSGWTKPRDIIYNSVY